MTYREKLQQEHPEYVSDGYAGGCKGCPKGYGYGPEETTNKNTCIQTGIRMLASLCALGAE